MAVEIFMPKMSDHMEAGEVIGWLAQEGDGVSKGQVIMEVMTDKAVAELESPASGILKGIRAGVEAGAQVPTGEIMAYIAQPDEAVPTLPSLGHGGAPKVELDTPPPSSAGPVPVEPGGVRAAPAVRRLAKELGIDLAQIRGTGPEGQIGMEDVHAFAEAQRRVAPAAVEEEGEWLDLTPIQRLTGQRMVESAQQVPQFTLTVGADMTNALWLREALADRVAARTGDRLSITALLVKVVAEALRRYPRANASFEAGRIRLHRSVNVGVAVGTDRGPVVPVIRGANQRSVVEIAVELSTLQEKAHRMCLGPEDLSDGTFTISNLGMYGIDRFQALVNPPQGAILAVGRIVKTPMGMPDDTVALRPMMALTLSVDHRCMDGVQGARFLAELRACLERPYFALF